MKLAMQRNSRLLKKVVNVGIRMRDFDVYLYPHSLSNHETSFTKLSDKASPAFESKMLDLSNQPNQITKHQT